MKIVCTYCSAKKKKDGGHLPAVQRYQSDRIARLAQEAEQRGLEFMILSGQFGLIAADEPLPWYDHLLQPEEVDTLAGKVAATLRLLQAREVEYHTVAPESTPPVRPYQAVMLAACARAGACLRVVILKESSPD